MTSLHVSRNWLVPFDALDAASPRGSAAPYWLDLDREAYAARLAELKQRVDTVLRPNYGGYELRDGWPIHIHVIWKLSTLAAELHRTYSGKRPRPTEPVPVRDAIAEYITKLIADAPVLPAEARSHLAALLTDTTDEA